MEIIQCSYELKAHKLAVLQSIQNTWATSELLKQTMAFILRLQHHLIPNCIFVFTVREGYQHFSVLNWFSPLSLIKLTLSLQKPKAAA